MRDIPVIPVLVWGAKMPYVEQLPDDLKELAYRNAVELTHPRWKSDVQVLIRALRPYLDPQRGDAPAAHGVDRQKEPGVPGGQVFEEQAAGRRPDAETIASNIEPKTIERVSKELAAYIGPISEVVVKRAAKRCSSVEDLYGMVAKEIKTETDRVKFLRSCRS